MRADHELDQGLRPLFQPRHGVRSRARARRSSFASIAAALGAWGRKSTSCRDELGVRRWRGYNGR